MFSSYTKCDFDTDWLKLIDNHTKYLNNAFPLIYVYYCEFLETFNIYLCSAISVHGTSQSSSVKSLLSKIQCRGKRKEMKAKIMEENAFSLSILIQLYVAKSSWNRWFWSGIWSRWKRCITQSGSQFQTWCELGKWVESLEEKEWVLCDGKARAEVVLKSMITWKREGHGELWSYG